MVRRRAELRVNVRGANLVLHKLRAVDPKLSEAQRVTGNRISKKLLSEARRIIRNKSPLSSGRLRESLYITQNKVRGGWQNKVTTDVPYATKVERGSGPERVFLNAELRDWIQRVLGEKALIGLGKKRYITVRKGNNPRYDTG